MLVIAHGAPVEGPNRLVLEMKPMICQALGKENPFGAVEIAFMEFAHPTVAEAVKSLEKSGCSCIVAVPLLIAPSDHSLIDIPALLGTYTDPEKTKELLGEGAEIARPEVPVTITPPLSAGDVLLECLLDKVRKISKEPQEEALVLVAHGSEMIRNEWNRLLRRCSSYVCGKTGITYADWACIEMGQGFLREGARAIWKAGKKRKRVLVAGLYLVTGIQDIARRFGRVPRTGEKVPEPMEELMEFLHGDRVVYTQTGLLPDERIASWIARTAREAAALQRTALGPEPIAIYDKENLLRLSVWNAARYHGDLDACGACAFRALQVALGLLWRDGIPRREDIRIESAHPSEGTRDMFEFVTRAATRGDLKIVLPPGTSIKEMAIANWVFIFTRKSTRESVEVRVKASVFPGGPKDFFSLRKKVKFDEDAGAELKRRFEAAKEELTASFLRNPPEELFEIKPK